jgi:hypothetical protein
MAVMMATAESAFTWLVKILTDINTSLFHSWPVALLTGIALCFFGLKIFRFSLFLFGCTVGAIIGFGLGNLVAQPWGGVAGAIVLGALGGYGFLFVLRIAGLIAGMALGGLVSAFLLGESGWIIPVTLASGICAFFFLSYFIMAGTAGWGAFLAIGGFATLLQLPFSQHQYLLAGAGIVLFVLGLGYQVFIRFRRS